MPPPHGGSSATTSSLRGGRQSACARPGPDHDGSAYREQGASRATPAAGHSAQPGAALCSADRWRRAGRGSDDRHARRGLGERSSRSARQGLPHRAEPGRPARARRLHVPGEGRGRPRRAPLHLRRSSASARGASPTRSAAPGCEKGDRVATLLPNCPAMLEAHFGVPAAGGILVTVNTRLSSAESRVHPRALRRPLPAARRGARRARRADRPRPAST